MKKTLVLTIIGLLMVAVAPLSAYALDLGNNITIFDGTANPTATNSWFRTQEDNEVEPYAVTGQQWDLEGFFYNANTAVLSMVGGFDFANGVEGVTAGDLFVDVDGGGYDYVMALNYAGLEYSLYQITADTVLTLADEPTMQASNPVSYDSLGIYLGSDSFLYTTGLTDADVGFTGDYHNLVQFDLALLSQFADLSNFTVHSTMTCGNDNLMGHYPVPEPASMALFGLGLLGVFTRKRK